MSMQTMSVGELEELLSKIKDKTLPVVIVENTLKYGTSYNSINHIEISPACIKGPDDLPHTAVILS
jgi:hypothetical protein